MSAAVTVTDEATIAFVIAEAVKVATEGLRRELSTTVADLATVRREVAALGAKALSYEGVYTPGTLYRKNALVTRSGSMWLCLVESTLSVPGHESSQWKLTVKEGSG